MPRRTGPARDRAPAPRGRTYRGRQLSQIAFPLGGIGTGTVSLGGRGQLQDWELFNRPAKGLALQHSFFALWAKPEGKPAVARVLEAEPGPPFPGSHGYAPGAAAGLPRFREAAFSSSYPFARVAFADPAVPVEARLEAFSPFVPLKDIDSGLPLAVFLVTVRNPGRRRVEASVAASLLNPVGLDGTESLVAPQHPAFGGNLNELVHEEHFWAVRMSSTRYEPTDVRFGSMALGALWPRVSAVTRWPRVGGWGLWDLAGVWEDFAQTGRIRGPADAAASETGRSDTASLCALLDLAPGESLTVPFLMAWSFPNRVNDWNTEPEVRGKVLVNYYATWFKDAWAALKYVTRDFERLTRESRAFERSFWTSTLPPEALESAGHQLATLRSQTCFRDETGRFFAFEGCGSYDGNGRVGCCPMNCSHVWNYAQAVAWLFPDLERSMRETDFQANLKPAGDMAFRTLVPLSAGVTWNFKPAADGQMGTILRFYRDWQICGDESMLRKGWPRVRSALEYAWKGWDADRDGLMEGEQHNTYDIEFWGPNPLTTLLYLGALRAGEEMAMAVGEPDAAREYRRVFESGSRRAVEKLWHGGYFRQIGDRAQDVHQCGDGCLTDQLLGQWMAHLADLGYLVPEKHVRQAAAAIFEHNFRDALRTVPVTGRVYALQDEAGLLLCSWPTGGRPKAPFPYADEVWTGCEYHVAATLILEGHVAEGLAVLRAVRARHDGERRNPFNEPECGNHYARGLASWSVLPALTGFRWSAPARALRFAPVVPAARTASFFSTGLAWGVMEEGWAGKRALVSFRVEGGSLAVRRLRLGSAHAKLERVWLEPAKTFLRGVLERRKGEAQVDFADTVELQPGQALVLATAKG